MAKKEEQQLAVMEPSNFLALRPEVNLQELMKINFENEQFGLMDLPKISVPSGGGTMFQFMTSKGAKSVESFVGIILNVHAYRQYWEIPYGEGESRPPDCVSLNMLWGKGNPGGKCSECPMNEFGSGKNKSKACKERRDIYVLIEESVMPYRISAPQKSINNVREYIKMLTVEGVFSHSRVTRFSLRSEKNTVGTAYSQLVLTNEAGVPEECLDKLYSLGQDIRDQVVKLRADKMVDEHREGQEAPPY